MSLTHSPSITLDGLVLCLDAGNPKSYPGSGTTWTDLSGNGNNGTLVNGVGFNSSNGGTLTFDGVNDYINLEQSNPIFYPTEGLTVSTWIKTSITDRWIIDNSRSTTSQGWGLNCGGSGSAFFLLNGVANNVGTEFSIATGNWISITATWSPSVSLLMYENGVQVGSKTIDIPSSINQPDPIYDINIGRKGAGDVTPRDYWNGNIAQVSIYNRALTAQEIQQNYNALKSRYQ